MQIKRISSIVQSKKCGHLRTLPGLLACLLFLTGCAHKSDHDSDILEVQAITTTKTISSGLPAEETEQKTDAPGPEENHKTADQTDPSYKRVEKTTTVIERPSATNMLTDDELKELWALVNGLYTKLPEPAEAADEQESNQLMISGQGILRIDCAAQSICGMQLHAPDGQSTVQGDFLGVHLLEPGVYEGVLHLEDGNTGLMRLYMPQASRAYLARKYGSSLDEAQADACLFVDISSGNAWQLQ